MEFENFQQVYPELYKQLLNGENSGNKRANRIEDKHYVYVKSRKSKYVYRMCKLDGSWMYSFHGLGEKPDKKNPNQRRLFEAETKKEI